MKNLIKVFGIVALIAAFAGCKQNGNYTDEMVSVKISTTVNTSAAREVYTEGTSYESAELTYQIIIQEEGKDALLNETYDSLADFEVEIPAGKYDFTVNAISEKTVVLTGTVNQEVTPENYEVQIELGLVEQKEVLGSLTYEVVWDKPVDKDYEIKFTITNLTDKTAVPVVEKINAVEQNLDKNEDIRSGRYILEKDLPKGTYSLKIEVIQYPNGVSGGIQKITTKYEPYFNVYPMMQTVGNYTFCKLNLAYTITYDCEVEYKVNAQLFNNYQKEILLDPVEKPYHDFKGWFVVETIEEENENDEAITLSEESDGTTTIEGSTTGDSGVVTGGTTTENLIPLYPNDDGKYVFRPSDYLRDVTIRAIFEQQIALPDLKVNFPKIVNAQVLDAYTDVTVVDEETEEETTEWESLSSELTFNEDTEDVEMKIYFKSNDEDFNADDYVWAWYKDGTLCPDTENTNKFTINTATDKGAVDLVVTASKDGKVIYTGSVSYFSYR